MKLKKFLVAGLAVVSAVALASCGNGGEKEVDPSAKLAAAKTSIEGTVKATYNLNYEVTVDANGGTSDFSSFRQQIEATYEIEYDQADNYLYLKKTWENKLKSGSKVTEEALLYKATDGKYHTVSTYQDDTEVSADITINTNVVSQSIAQFTNEKSGYIELETLLYNKNDSSYEIKYFGLKTESYIADIEMAASKYYDNGDGLKVVCEPKYVGYTTDQGLSNFPGKDNGKAATVTIKTNANGYVTSFTEDYSAALNFQIMTPPPTVGIKGSRSLTAEYGATLTKKNTLTHPASTLSFANPEHGSVKVYDITGTNYNGAVPVTTGATLTKAGHSLAVAITPDDGYEVESVTLNGSALSQAPNGMYVTSIAYGTNAIVVTMKSAEAPTYGDNVKWVYSGTSNGIKIRLEFYTDNTYAIFCPEFKDMKAMDGTYALGKTINLTYTGTPHAAMGATNTTAALTYSSDFKNLTCADFFADAKAATFTLSYAKK